MDVTIDFTNFEANIGPVDRGGRRRWEGRHDAVESSIGAQCRVYTYGKEAFVAVD